MKKAKTLVLTLHVKKIEGYKDADGKLGKVIELVEERPLRSPIIANAEIGEVVSQTMQTLQTVFPQMKFMRGFLSAPKMILFLTEEETDELGVNFEVNKAYIINMENRKIEFKEA